MPSFIRFWLILFICAIGICTRVQAQENEPVFKHSPSAERSFESYQHDLLELAEDYQRLVAQSDRKFKKSAKRHLDRYESIVELEVRNLTRADSIEAAQASNDLLALLIELEITPPDHEGLHFLSSINLEVAGSDIITKYGVDLLVNVESLGVLYSKQIDAGFAQYKSKVTSTRDAYIKALERVRAKEKQAGRLEAVQEIQAEIDAQKQLPEIQRPVIETGDEVYDGPIAADKPKYVGYFIIGYSTGFLERQKYLIQLSEDGGMVHSRYVYTSETKGKWETISLPIKIVSHEENVLVFTHKAELRNTEVVHEISLNDGVPIKDQAWASEKDRDAGRHAANGNIRLAGSPGADLLGLKDGVYLMKKKEVRTLSGGKVLVGHKHFIDRIVVENGVIYRTHRSQSEDAAEWEPVGHNFYHVQAKDGKLILTYDKNMLPEWENVYIINMKDNDDQEMAGWWKAEHAKENRHPNFEGKLIRVKDE